MIKYAHGDATNPGGNGARYIVHVCNDAGGWGAGFTGAISKRWKAPEDQYRAWFKRKTHTRAGYFELGSVLIVPVEEKLWICNMVAQDGFGPKEGADRVRLKYDALETCLTKVSTEARIRKGSIHMPRIGCSLAGGSWSKVEPIIESTLGGLDVTVYDFPGGRFNP
jgi:O-acetyl-ADP-ribose deacetylase (regulator of RNase III)